MDYGIVYLWHDRKRNKFYIGSHWGSEDDGYVCSSKRMKYAYKKRPEDFKRRILNRVHTNRKDMLDKENDWLQLIPEEELGNKYYNLQKHRFNHWSAEDQAKVKQTISERTKEAMWRPEVRERYLKGLETREMNIDPETLAKRNAHNSEKMKGRKPAPQTVQASVAARKGKKLSADHKAKVLGAIHKKVTCPYCDLETNTGNMARHMKARH